MSLDTKTVGSADRNITLLGDPSAAASLQSVLSLTDARSLSGLFAALSQGVNILLNGSGTFDQQRSAIGTTGIPAINTEGVKNTYSVAIAGFTPAATATDFFTLVGSASKTVRLLRAAVSGIASSGVTAEVLLIKRSTANSGGTASNPTIAPHDSNDAAASATVNQYSANPTTGTSVGTVRAQKLNLGATGAAGQIVWDFTNRNSKGLVLRGVAQALCLNWAAATVPGGTSLAIELEWSEE